MCSYDCPFFGLLCVPSCVLLLIRRIIFVCSASASSSLCILLLVITLLVGVTTAAAADSTAAAAAAGSSSEGNDSRGVGSILHGFKNDVVQEQLNLHHHHHREQEDESVRGALRGFKKKEGEQQKLWWENGHNSGQVTPSGYHWWNPNAGGKNRDATGDYQLTKEALVKVAYYSMVAAAAATETASAASTYDPSAADPSALMTALGDLVGNAAEAETYACLAESLVGTKSEDKLDGEDSSTNLLKGMEAIPGMARSIENLAKQTAQFAEMAIVAIDRPVRTVREIETATVATKTKAQTTKNLVGQLQVLMISNAGSDPGQDSLIGTAP